MPFIAPTVAVLRAFERGLTDLAAPNDPALLLLQGVRQGQHVYTLGLQDILTGPGIGAATLAGWLFVAGNAANSVAAQVTAPLGDNTPAISSISNDPEIAKTIQAIRTAETMPLFHQPGSELRVLKIPGVLVEAVWLKPALGDGEVMPYLTLSRSLQLMSWYPAQDFLNTLKPLATQFLIFGSATVNVNVKR